MFSRRGAVAAKIGSRIKALREQRGQSQDDVARLFGFMERELGLLVLMVDPIKGVSGAACRLPDLDAVLINRREIAGRRHFDLAHELFHVLTWDAMPPEHMEEAADISRNR